MAATSTSEESPFSNVHRCPSLLLCYIGAVLYGVFILREFCRKGFLLDLKGFRAKFPRRLKGQGVSPLEVKVWTFVQRQRIRLMNCAVVHFVHMSGMFLLAYLFLQLAYATCWDRQPLNLEFVDELQVVSWLMVCLLFVHVSRMATPLLIEFAYVGSTIWWMCRPWIVGADELDKALFKVTLVRAVLGILVCNASLTSVCNVWVMLVHITALLHIETGNHAQRMYVIVEEIGATVLIVCTLFVCDAGVLSMCRQVIKAESEPSESEAAVLKLLSAVCDAVVTLGPDGRISSKSPKFGTLLFQETDTSLSGMLFEDLLIESDKDKFQEFLARCPGDVDEQSEPEIAQALSVNLRDTSGISGMAFLVELFHSTCQESDEQVSHLIGIREIGEHGRGRNTDGNLQQDNHKKPVEGECAANERMVSEASFNLEGASVNSSHKRTRVATATGSSDKSRRPCQRDLSVVCDSLRFRLQDKSSDSANELVNSVTDDTLLLWASSWSTSRLWLQDLVNLIIGQEAVSSWSLNSGNTTLSFQMSLRCSCQLPQDLYFRNAQPTSSSGSTRNPQPTCSNSKASTLDHSSNYDRPGPIQKLTIRRLRLVLDPKPRPKSRRETDRTEVPLSPNKNNKVNLLQRPVKAAVHVKQAASSQCAALRSGIIAL